jgi:drug/metabolite transporter (DMT)-like permease
MAQREGRSRVEGHPPHGATAEAGGRDPIGGAFIAVASVLFGGVVILGKTLPEDLPVTSMLAVRFAVAALLLALVLALRRQPLRAARGEGRRLVLLGAVGYAVESAFFFLALDRGTAAAVTLLFFTYPVLVTVLSAVLGMGLPGWLVGGSLLVAVTGAALVVASGGGLDITAAGIGFALASALTFSFYLLGADALVSKTSSLGSAMWVSASAAAALAIYAVTGGAERFPEGLQEWLRVSAMGVLTAAAFVSLFLGLRRVGAVRTAIIAALEPVATSVMAVAILGEVLRPGVAIGGALILAAAVAASLARRRPRAEAIP